MFFSHCVSPVVGLAVGANDFGRSPFLRIRLFQGESGGGERASQEERLGSSSSPEAFEITLLVLESSLDQTLQPPEEN